MTKEKFNVRVLAEIAILSALGFVLDLVQAAFGDAFWPNGGSIGIAMLPILIISLRRGVLPGFVTGLILGLLQMLTGFYTVSDLWWKNFLQLCLDYVFPYSLVSLSGLFRPLINKESKTKSLVFVSLAGVCGGLMKFLSHFLAGVFFWPESASDGPVARITYSFTYNGSYMIPSIIISTIVLVLIVAAHKEFIFVDAKKDYSVLEKESVHPTAKLVSSIVIGVVSLVVFIVFTVLSVKESKYEYNEYAENTLGLAATYVTVVLVGICGLIISCYYLIGFFKNKAQSVKAYFIGLYVAFIASIFVPLFYIFEFSYKVYSKSKDPIEKGYPNPAKFAIFIIIGVLGLIITRPLDEKFNEVEF